MAAALCALYKHGREPHVNDIRHELGMAEYVSVMVCPLHGVIHEKRCPGANPKPRPKRRDWRGLALTLTGILVNK